jgi:hypothetical protein
MPTFRDVGFLRVPWATLNRTYNNNPVPSWVSRLAASLFDTLDAAVTAYTQLGLWTL